MDFLAKPLRRKLESTVIAARDLAEAAARSVLEHLGVGEKDAPGHLTEDQRALERLLTGLDPETFQAQDSLGWVYQFWQAKKKEEVNRSEVKIGADELPAVTQLFTEPYMVSFLLDNSLGAWWVANHPDKPRPVPLEYLRLLPPSPTVRGTRGEGLLSPLPLGEGPGVRVKKLPKDILRYARDLRKNQTDAEQLLWSLLRNRRLLNKKFRRQHPIDRYILDFYCHESKLAIELDGGQHNEASAVSGDHYRTQFLSEQGIKVLRFWNNDMLQHTESVLEVIYCALAEEPSPQTPLPEGEGLMPAAGCSEAWPKHLSELKVLDPCCGSGHFLVAAFLMLVPMRMTLEGLLADEAVDRVLAENIHGLELDQRCVELAAFALALTAWRYPKNPLPPSVRRATTIPPSPPGRGAGGEGEKLGYRPLPELNLACSGLSLGATKEEWKHLATNKHNLHIALDWMHDTFRYAPVLGSLLNPAKTDAAKTVEWGEISKTIEQALSPRQTDEQHETGVAAQGLAKADTLLAGQYHWVITNVPCLSRGKQSDTLRDFCEHHYPAAKNDLATVFLERCLEFCLPPSPLGRGAGGEGALGGTVSVVLPQNWLFLTSYKKFREKLLKNDIWHQIARLGPGAFETISGEVVKAILITLSRGNSLTPNPSPRGRGPG